MSIAERVAAGAAFLDEHDYGFVKWVDRVDLGELELSSPCLCVLGQLFRNEGNPYMSYSLARTRFKLTPEQGEALGFDAMRDEDEADEEYDELTAEWKRLIEARRSA